MWRLYNTLCYTTTTRPGRDGRTPVVPLRAAFDHREYVHGASQSPYPFFTCTVTVTLETPNLWNSPNTGAVVVTLPCADPALRDRGVKRDGSTIYPRGHTTSTYLRM